LYGVRLREHKSLVIFFISVGYLISGLLFIPFTIGALGSYNATMAIPVSLMQLLVVIAVLVLIPLLLAYGIYKGYRFAWALGILYGVFTIVLYLITFASIGIVLSTGALVSRWAAVSPISYTIAYTIIYVAAYAIAIAAILLNVGLIYFLTRKSTKDYFGIK
jgi:hypothetical protein